MKISGTKSYVDIEKNGKTARFWGDLCINGFQAVASTMEWITGGNGSKPSDAERTSLMKEVRKSRSKHFKITFVDDTGKKIR